MCIILLSFMWLTKTAGSKPLHTTQQPVENVAETAKVTEEGKQEIFETMQNCSERASRKQSKPKAFEFWETLANMDQPPAPPPRVDVRYNTIHRMSVGRRQLPQPPPNNKTQTSSQQIQDNQILHHLRSQSLDRTMMETSDSRIRNDGSSLNSRYMA